MFIRNFNKEVYKLKSSEAVAEMMFTLLQKIRGYQKQRERMWCIGLDNGNNVQYIEIASVGTVDQAVIYPREVIRTAIVKGTTRIIIVHNHPSGSINPSTQDIELTKKLKSGAETLDVELLDHLIINNKDKQYYSFRENNLI